MEKALQSLYEWITGFVSNKTTQGVVLAVLAIIVMIGLFQVIARWKLYQRAGYPGWACLIPYYDDYVLIRMGGLRGLPMVLVFGLTLIPDIDAFTFSFINIMVARRFGKDIGFGLGLQFLPLIFYPILAFGGGHYENKEYRIGKKILGVEI